MLSELFFNCLITYRKKLQLFEVLKNCCGNCQFLTKRKNQFKKDQSLGQRLFNKRPPELTDPVTVGLTYKGIYLHKAKKSAPQLFPWRTIHAIAFRKTLVLLKFHKVRKVST